VSDAASAGGTAASRSSEAVEALYDDALENLVRQFARPLDCLRELVQNSIDAGSPRVEVRLGWTPPKDAEVEGVLAITVEDFGHGMDEHVIDQELTRMFASSKAGDLSKIGRFGIGFTSVFAIAPDLVHLRTGRHGEGWELVFHPDRSFDKLRVDRPIQGTRIVLYKRMPPADLGRWKRDIRSSLTFWCEHCTIPILFDNGQHAPTAAPTDSADPFAAFEDAPAPQLQAIQRPLDLPEASWSVKHDADGIVVWAGLGDSPQFGWYNGGLTLLSTPDPSCLGPNRFPVRHLRLKVQHNRLEHTLTRDNVIQDGEWERAMVVVRRAVAMLLEHVLDTHEAAVAEGESLDSTLDALAAWVRADGEFPPARKVGQRLHLPQVKGGPAPIPVAGALDGLKGGPTRWLLAAENSRLTDALAERGWLVFEDRPAARTLLELLHGDAEQGRRDWVLVEPVDPSDGWAHLLEAVEALQARSSGHRPRVELCRVVTNGVDPSLVPLVIHRPPSKEPVHHLGLGPGLWHRLWGTPPTVWVNVAHPNVQLAADSALVSPDVGAYALLQAIFITDPAVGGHASAWRAVQKAVSA